VLKLVAFIKKIMLNAHQLIQQYSLQPHPEGGWYKENYRSTESFSTELLPERFKGGRSFSTAIYFLLEQGNFSAFHKIKSDECWHFYAGDPLYIYVLQTTGVLDIICLGNDIENGQLFQYVVPANCWFASRPSPTSKFCFVGCTVAPGFDFTDFEMADKLLLTAAFPQHTNTISELCR